MEVFRIEGGVPLVGTVAAAGAKNAALPIMAASLLADGPVRLERVPGLIDVDTLTLVLGRLGVEGVRLPDGGLLLETIDRSPVKAQYDLVRRMRASFCVLGPLLARRGRAVVSLPGGCNIGPRPVDLHLSAMAALGADVRIRHGYVIASARRLRGARINMAGPRGATVTGTANAMSAAVLAHGVTTLSGAALEPEIVDLGNFLVAMGARIDGLGTATITITGVDQLHGVTYRIIPDRIETATLLAAGAITGGRVTVTGANADHMHAVLARLEAMGAAIETAGDRISLIAPDRPLSTRITARPYPGVPTDVQSQFMALATVASGTSRVRDTVFPERFMHVAELARLRADIQRKGSAAMVRGVERLDGAEVIASDLRASAALVLAGLAARGQTVVHAINHLDRGYERLDEKLNGLGGRIQRLGAPAALLPACARAKA